MSKSSIDASLSVVVLFDRFLDAIFSQSRLFFGNDSYFYDNNFIFFLLLCMK
jgi:hypothetical protein